MNEKREARVPMMQDGKDTGNVASDDDEDEEEDEEGEEEEEEEDGQDSRVDLSSVGVSKSPKKRKLDSVINAASIVQGVGSEVNEPKRKKRKRSEKCKVCGEKGHRKMDCEKLPEERRKELQELNRMKVERKGKGTGRKKRKKNKGEAASPEEVEKAAPGRYVRPPGFSENKVRQGNKKEGGKNKKKDFKKPMKDRLGMVVGEGEGLFQGFR